MPELALGLAFFLVGAIGYPLGLGAVLPGVPESLARALFAVSQLATGVGSAAVFVFTRCVFRPQAGWARLDRARRGRSCSPCRPRSASRAR